MKPEITDAIRFRACRERAGLSIDEAAARAGISGSCAWDLECQPSELREMYSPAELRRFADLFGVRPADLLGTDPSADPVSADGLASAIRRYCDDRGVTVEAFGNLAGWNVAAALVSPRYLLDDLCLEGTRDVCDALGIDCERFVAGL